MHTFVAMAWAALAHNGVAEHLLLPMQAEHATGLRPHAFALQVGPLALGTFGATSLAVGPVSHLHD